MCLFNKKEHISKVSVTDSQLLSMLSLFLLSFFLYINMLTDVHPYAYIFSTYKHRVVMNNEMIEQHNEKWYN